MAISSGDGSIILNTKVDTKGLNSGLASMKGAITKIGGLLAATFSVKTLINFAKESKNLYKIQMENEVKLATVMRQRMKATDDEIKSMLELASAQQQVGIIGDEVQLAGLQQIATFATQKETIETLLPAMNNLIAQQYGYEASAESARNAANLMGKVLQGQTGALTRVGITFSEAEEAALKTGNEMERAAVLAKVITNNVGEMNRALAQTDIGRQKQLANTFGDIKEQFGAAFTQLSILFLPALQFLAKVLATIAQLARAAAQAVANMFGKEITKNTQATQSSIGGSVEGMEDLADATKKAGKEAKKSLSAFDELNVLSSGESDGGAGTEVASGAVAGVGATGTGFDFGIQGKSGEIDAEMSAIMGIAGGALAAIGLLLLFFGHPLWGVSFIVMGATALGVSLTTLAKSDAENLISEKLMKILAIAGTALAALGLILLFGGVWKWGIAFLIAGAAALGVAIVATKSGKVDEEAKEMLINIMTVAGTAMLALGVILLCFGVVSPLSIGLVVAGAASLAATVALNWNFIVDKAKEIFNAVIDWVKTYGLLVLGIILCLTGAGIPLGIALIIKWAKDGAEKGVPLATAIVDKVKEIWAAVQQFWNTRIAPIFTAEWWKNLGKKAMNGLIAGFEAGINGIIGMFEKMINWVVNGLNKISFDVPDWVPLIGGKTFGFNIPEVKFGRVSIPRLAQGAVIPPNREFLAILGDQKSGTNIEAPLSTIVDAFKAVQGNQKIEIKFTGSLAQLARVLAPEISTENNRTSIFAKG